MTHNDRPRVITPENATPEERASIEARFNWDPGSLQMHDPETGKWIPMEDYAAKYPSERDEDFA